MVDDQGQTNRQMNCMENVAQNCQSTFRMDDFAFNFPAASFPCIDCSSQTQSFPMMPQGFVVLQPPPPAPPKPAPPPPPPPIQQPACGSLCPMCAQIANRLLSAGNSPRSCPLFSRHSEHPLFSSSLPQAHGHDCECMRCTLPSKRADSALFKCPASSSAKSSRDQRYFNELNDMLDEKIEKILKPVLMTLAKVLPSPQPDPSIPAKSVKTCSCSSVNSCSYRPEFYIPSKVYIDSESDSDEEEYKKPAIFKTKMLKKNRQFETKTDKDDDYQRYNKKPSEYDKKYEPERRTKFKETIPKEKRDILNEGMIDLETTSMDSDDQDSSTSKNRNCTTNKCHNKKNVSFNNRNRNRHIDFKTDEDFPMKRQTSSNSADLALTNLLKRM